MGSPGEPFKGDVHDQAKNRCDRRNREDGQRRR